MHVHCAGPRTGTCRRIADPPPQSQHAASQDEAILLSTGRTGETISSVVMQHLALYEAVG
jgi:hypothetical protein